VYTASAGSVHPRLCPDRPSGIVRCHGLAVNGRPRTERRSDRLPLNGLVGASGRPSPETELLLLGEDAIGDGGRRAAGDGPLPSAPPRPGCERPRGSILGASQPGAITTPRSRNASDPARPAARTRSLQRRRERASEAPRREHRSLLTHHLCWCGCTLKHGQHPSSFWLLRGSCARTIAAVGDCLSVRQLAHPNRKHRDGAAVHARHREADRVTLYLHPENVE